MSSKNYRVMKVFDCQEMPDDIRKMFFDVSVALNDSYVEYLIEDPRWESEWSASYIAINNWLIANGAELNEKVIISHWW
jgi:hypothetical protein